MNKPDSVNSYLEDLKERKAQNEKTNKILTGYFTMDFLERWFSELSNSDIVKYWIKQWYITNWWSAKDVAHKLWELDKDMGDFLLKVVEYNIKKNKWKWGKNFSLTGKVNGIFYENPRKYLEAIYDKLENFKLSNYLQIPTLAEVEAMVKTGKLKFPENSRDELWNNFSWRDKERDKKWDYWNASEFKFKIRPLQD